MIRCSSYSDSKIYKLDILALKAASLPCTHSSPKASILVCRGSDCLSACLLRRLASRFRASLACLVSACSAALCSQFRSRSLSSLAAALLPPVQLLCVRGCAHAVFLAWPA